MCVWAVCVVVFIDGGSEEGVRDRDHNLGPIRWCLKTRSAFAEIDHLLSRAPGSHSWGPHTRERETQTNGCIRNGKKERSSTRGRSHNQTNKIRS